MLKIYSTGCISCLEAVKILRRNKIEFIVEDNQKIVEDIAIKTIGFIPVFEFDGKFFNHLEIKTMASNGADFKDMPKVVEVEKVIDEEPKIINKK